MALNKEALLSGARLKQEEVETPVGTVIVRELTSSDRDAFEASCVLTNGKDVTVNMENLRAKLVAVSVIDPDTGEKMLTVEEAGNLPASFTGPVFVAAQRISGLKTEDVDEIAKNSATAPSEGSSSGSLRISA